MGVGGKGVGVPPPPLLSPLLHANKKNTVADIAVAALIIYMVLF